MNWSDAIVSMLAFAHVDASPACLGSTTWTSSRARCACGWEVSGRLEDAGQRRSAVFALAALAIVGWVVARVHDEAERDNAEMTRPPAFEGSVAEFAALYDVTTNLIGPWTEDRDTGDEDPHEKPPVLHVAATLLAPVHEAVFVHRVEV